MGRHTLLPTSLILLLASMSVFWASCSATQTKPMPPTPTPIPAGGSIFFDPLRISTETEAIEVRVVNCSGRVPAVESAIVITEPATLQAITTTLLSAVSTTPSTDLAMQQGSGYLMSLYLYSRDNVLPLSGTSGPWLLADVTYNYDVGVLAIHLLDAQDEEKIEFYPIGPVLRDILEHEMVIRGLTLPH